MLGELLHALALKRGMPSEHFKVNSAQRPNICFESVTLFMNNLRGHEKRGSADCVIGIFWQRDEFRKSEIADFNIEVHLHQVDL